MTAIAGQHAAADSRRPPGPRGLDVIAALLDFKRRRVVALEDAAHTYGDIVALHCLGFKAYLIAGPDLIHHVLVTNADNYAKSPGGRRARRFFGHSLQTTSGPLARSRRQMMSTALNRERVRPYTGRIVGSTSAMLDTWTGGEVRNVSTDIMQLVLDAGIQIHFGTAPGAASERIREPFVAALQRLDSFLRLPPPFPTRSNRAYARAADTLDTVVAACIAERRAAAEPADDVLSSLLEMKTPEGGRLTDRQIRDEIMSTLAASYFTTAAALIQIVRLLSEHPDVDTALAAELDSVLQERAPAWIDLERLTLTGQVVKEALRLCPPAGAMARIAIADDRIGGWRIPAGARVIVSQWVLQRRSDWYTEPQLFRPERWTPDFERALPAYAYFPFGLGARSCIGQSLATMELQLMLATVAQRFRFEPIRHTPPSMIIDDILESGGLELRVHPRAPRRPTHQ